MSLPEKIVHLHNTLEDAQLPHAFGGALALAWCTLRARGTIDIDINIFIEQENFELALAALPKAVSQTSRQRKALREEGQVRLWWEKTPIDIFLNSTPFHKAVAKRVRWETFLGTEIPFLSCNDLAIFKTFFNRTQDWADLEAMQAAGTLDKQKVIGVLTQYLGRDDSRVERLINLKN